ncbi:MAG: methyltransferase type 11 [Candidatus Methanomethylicota archaeon]|uniref:Methyltransferase type 11 n=1 Tax=Thermoproteota archaeon TaxID=2056631 RepID=A0A497EMV4_9CREN|nr:MAG: methyltransferase type 11 [Candidatus Verstraetearchaeota archaeon]
MAFEQEAPKYDEWFLKNRNVLYSEVLLVKYFLEKYGVGKALSVGCGSALFEMILRDEFDIKVDYCLEPAEGMAKIAEKRGFKVDRGYAENLPYPDEFFDTVIQNGTIHYVDDPIKAIEESYRVLRRGGQVIIAWVAGESSYGILYQLAGILGNWEPLKKIAPKDPYPIEFIREAKRWPTAEEVGELVKSAGFTNIEFVQTLTTHPKYSNDLVEEPSEGYTKGDYIALRAIKPF